MIKIRKNRRLVIWVAVSDPVWVDLGLNQKNVLADRLVS